MVMLPYKKHFLKEKTMQHIETRNVILGTIYGAFLLSAYVMADFCKYIVC